MSKRVTSFFFAQDWLVSSLHCQQRCLIRSSGFLSGIARFPRKEDVLLFCQKYVVHGRRKVGRGKRSLDFKI